MLLNIRKFFDFGGLEQQRRDGLVKKKKEKRLGGFSNSIFEPLPHLLNRNAHISVEPPKRTENARLMLKTMKKGHVSLH